MSEFDPNRTDPELNPAEPPEEKPPFVPSPVSRRIWAWMGVAYVILAMVLITYWIACSAFLSGITGLMLFPLLGALSAQGFNNLRLNRRGEWGGKPVLLGLSAGGMGVIALASLVLGIFQLTAALGG